MIRVLLLHTALWKDLGLLVNYINGTKTENLNAIMKKTAIEEI